MDIGGVTLTIGLIGYLLWVTHKERGRDPWEAFSSRPSVKRDTPTIYIDPIERDQPYDWEQE